MKITSLHLQGVKVITPDIHEDARGAFFESWQHERFLDNYLDYDFVQDNISFSSYATVRGMHYQVDYPQAKLITVLQGEIFDVIVDIRKSSITFGQYHSTVLSSYNRKQLLVPRGFAHGFCATTDDVIVQYKCDQVYYSECHRTILYNDSTLHIKWPKLVLPYKLSEADAIAPSFLEAMK